MPKQPLNPIEPPEGMELISSRIEARKLAQEYLDLIDQDTVGMTPVASAVFWRIVRDRAIAELPLPDSKTAVKPMSDSEAKMFELSGMEIGHKHEGREVGQVHEEDPGYLHYLIQKHPFVARLERYLASDRAKGLEKEPDDDFEF